VTASRSPSANDMQFFQDPLKETMTRSSVITNECSSITKEYSLYSSINR
jgi:hypothetical protein